LRERILVLDEALDQLTGRGRPFGSARMLGQVYNGGAMPNVVPAVYLTHPLQVTGSESEGAAGTAQVDTSTTVPVVVFGHVPSVGDYLNATAAGGRWVAGAGGITCPVTVCVTCTGTAIPGATVTILSGVTQVAQCTAGSNGCCTVQIPSAGTYTVQVQATGYSTYSAGQNLICGQTLTADLCGCNPCLPTSGNVTLTLTLAAGGFSQITLLKTPGQYFWTGSAGLTTATLTCVGNQIQFLVVVSAAVGLRGEYPACTGVPPGAVCCALPLESLACSPLDIGFGTCPLLSTTYTQFQLTH
jgi:hypothetical protein